VKEQTVTEQQSESVVEQAERAFLEVGRRREALRDRMDALDARRRRLKDAAAAKALAVEAANLVAEMAALLAAATAAEARLSGRRVRPRGC
jgi:hypothetical protein